MTITSFHKHVIDCKCNKSAGQIFLALTKKCNNLTCFDEMLYSGNTNLYKYKGKDIITISYSGTRRVVLCINFYNSVEDNLADIEEDLFDTIHDATEEEYVYDE